MMHLIIVGQNLLYGLPWDLKRHNDALNNTWSHLIVRPINHSTYMSPCGHHSNHMIIVDINPLVSKSSLVISSEHGRKPARWSLLYKTSNGAMALWYMERVERRHPASIHWFNLNSTRPPLTWSPSHIEMGEQGYLSENSTQDRGDSNPDACMTFEAVRRSTIAPRPLLLRWPCFLISELNRTRELVVGGTASSAIKINSKHPFFPGQAFTRTNCQRRPRKQHLWASARSAWMLAVNKPTQLKCGPWIAVFVLLRENQRF